MPAGAPLHPLVSGPPCEKAHLGMPDLQAFAKEARNPDFYFKCPNEMSATNSKLQGR